MRTLGLLLAAEADLGFLRSNGVQLGKGTGFWVRDVFLVLGAVLVLSLILVVWAKYLRRSKREPHRRRHHRHHHHHHSEEQSAAPAHASLESDASQSPNSNEEMTEDDAESSQPAPHRHRRQRIRRRSHRPRNPTLAETGGLPPVRNPDTPPPGS
jgi:hypothetical protein